MSALVFTTGRWSHHWEDIPPYQSFPLIVNSCVAAAAGILWTTLYVFVGGTYCLVLVLLYLAGGPIESLRVMLSRWGILEPLQLRDIY